MLAVALFVLPTIAQTEDMFRVTANPLNVRTGPGIEYEIVGQLYSNSMYPIVAYSPTRNWVLLDLGGVEAWAFVHLGDVISASGAEDANLGQGGGAVVPTDTVTVVTLINTIDEAIEIDPADYFNATIGVTATVNVRRSPALNAQPLTFIPYGQRATPIGRTDNGIWIQVNYEGIVGWVYFMNVAFPPLLNVTTLPVTG